MSILTLIVVIFGSKSNSSPCLLSVTTEIFGLQCSCNWLLLSILELLLLLLIELAVVMSRFVGCRSCTGSDAERRI